MDNFWILSLLHSVSDMNFTFWHFKFAHFSSNISRSLKICYLGYFCFCRYFGYLCLCSVYYFNMPLTFTIVTTLCRDASIVSISQFYLSCHAVNTDHKKADWPLCLMKHLSMETYGEVAVWLHSCITSPPLQWSASHPFPLIPSEKKKKALDSHKTGDRVWRLSRRENSLATDESEILVLHPATLPTVEN